MRSTKDGVDPTRAALRQHARALRYRCGEFFPDIEGEQLLRDVHLAIKHWLRKRDIRVFPPLLARVRAQKAAEGAVTDGDAPSALYAAAEDLHQLIDHGGILPRSTGPSADDYPGLLTPIADAFARLAER